MILHARHFETGRVVEVAIEGDRIRTLRTDHAASTEGLPFIAPGLFDLQINGRNGVWFSDENLTVDQVLSVLNAYFAYGVTRLFPTLITNSREALIHGFETVRRACEREPWADALVAGCHLEGPYISHEDGPRGAHPPEHVRDCNWEEFQSLQQASGGRIRLITLAPESAGACDFIRRAVRSGVVVSLGHTNATTDQITAAVDAGARLSTHLGNGAHAVLPRHPHYIWDQLGEPRLMASLISDGHHLPPSVVRSIVFAKGVEGVIVTCDASGLAGLPVGRHEYHGHWFETLPDGRIVVANEHRYLAGSALETATCLARMAGMLGCPVADVWPMATTNPARLLNVEIGSLEPGGIADLILFEHDPEQQSLRVLETYSRGCRRYRHPQASDAGISDEALAR